MPIWSMVAMVIMIFRKKCLLVNLLFIFRKTIYELMLKNQLFLCNFKMKIPLSNYKKEFLFCGGQDRVKDRVGWLA